MSCRRHQHDLSRCLDGRLPAKARARALQHVDDCPRCALVWTQMRAAQAAVLGLDELRVGPDFRDGVWARIQAGEGAAEVALHPEVSAAAKLRYGLVGAAAAAVVLAVFHWGIRGTGATGAPDAQVARSEPAAVPPPGPGVEAAADSSPLLARKGPGGAEPGAAGAAERAGPSVAGLERTAPQGSVATALTFVPPFVENEEVPALAVIECANQAANQVRSASRRLSLQASLLDRAPEQIPSERWVSVRGDLRQIEDGLDLLSRMEQAGVLDLKGNARDCLLLARRTLRVQRPQDPRELQGAVRLLTSCPLHDISDAIYFPSRAFGDSKWLLRVIETYPNYRDAAEAFENTLRFRIILRNQDGTWHDMSGVQPGGLRIRSTYRPPPRPQVGAENRQDGD